MEFAVPYTALVAFLLATTRALAFLITVPPFNATGTISRNVTIGIAASLGLLSAHSIPPATLPSSTAGLIGALVLQLMTGAALGFVVSILIQAMAAAGSFLDLTGGLNQPPSIDPLGIGQTSTLGQFYEQTMLLVLLTSGGWLIILQGYLHSFSMPGFDLADSNRVAYVLTSDLSTFFVSAVEIVAPIMLVLFAIQIALGLVSRAAPQINVWLLGMPLQIFVALAMVAIGISTVPGWTSALLVRATNDITTMFSGLK